MDHTKPAKTNRPSDRQLYLFAFRAFGDFSGTIAIPAILATLLGHWLDERYGTSPLFLLGLLVLTFALTGVVIYRKAKAYGEGYKRLFPSDTNQAKHEQH